MLALPGKTGGETVSEPKCGIGVHLLQSTQSCCAGDIWIALKSSTHWMQYTLDEEGKS